MPFAYDPSSVEKKWQKKWADAKLYEVDRKKAKDPFYNLVMFPYPSGDKLHVGHWYNFAPADSFGRYMRMKGKQVFEPMGFDAFGLPAENYAIKTGIHPAQSIKKNVETMIAQLSRIGCMYDWSQMVNTSDPSYYRWTQWLFLQMYEHTLAYKKEANVNYCPSCQTVLAREQAQDGKCERCGTEVIQKPLNQWFWKITDYADQLIDNLEGLDWPEKTKTMQRNWIGRSEGAEIVFQVDLHKDHPRWETEKEPPIITVFTTRPDTLFGATYLVLAPEHPLVELITPKAHWGAVQAYREEVKKKTELQRTDLAKEKTGVATGAYALHPATGEHIPIWIADYVLLSYGTGAIMAVPAHDERDFAFASIMKLPIVPVLQATVGTYVIIEKSLPKAAIAKLSSFGEVTIEKTDKEWGKFFQVAPASQEQEKKLVHFLEAHLLTSSDDGGAWYADSLGSTWNVVYPKKTFHVIDQESLDAARQHGLSLGIPEDQVAFSFGDRGALTGDGLAINSDFLNGLTTPEAKKKMIAWLEDEEKGRERITYRLRDWLISRQRYWGAPIPIVYDPEGKPHAIPEKHLPWLLPTDVEFKPTGESPLKHSKEFRERTETLFGKGWTPEYDTMDTFVCSSFYYLRYLAAEEEKHVVDPHVEREWMPVDMYIGGPEHACMHLIYARFVMMALKDFGFVSNEEPFKKLVHQGLITSQGAKMSKSKGNVVSPDSFIDRHGSDVFRMYLMFMGPFTDGGDWSDSGIKGIDRFVQRTFTILPSKLNKKIAHEEKTMQSALHRTIKAVTESLDRLHFNTAISSLMELLNTIEKAGHIAQETAETYVKLLAPLAPHLADELWEQLCAMSSTHTKQSKGKKSAQGPTAGFIVDQHWPTFDPTLLVSDIVTIAVQVNGKLRGDLEVPTNAAKDAIIALAKKQPNVAKHLEGQTIKKEIYVPGKLVNFVV